MSYALSLKRAGWCVFVVMIGVPALQAQSPPAYTFSDQRLREAGWTTTQIAELRATAPKLAAKPKAESKEPTELGYSSVFDNYQPYEYLPDIGWREANDEVGKIGGWRSYAKLVQQAQKEELEKEQQESEGGQQ